jgi:hypothetical protein
VLIIPPKPPHFPFLKRLFQLGNTLLIERDSYHFPYGDTFIDIQFKNAINNTLDMLGKHLSLRILNLEHVQELVACLHCIANLAVLKSFVVGSATKHERKKTYMKFLTGSNPTLQKLIGEVPPLQVPLDLHTMKSGIPTELNHVLDFFFLQITEFCFFVSKRALIVVEVIQTCPLNASMQKHQ